MNKRTKLLFILLAMTVHSNSTVASVSAKSHNIQNSQAGSELSVSTVSSISTKQSTTDSESNYALINKISTSASYKEPIQVGSIPILDWSLMSRQTFNTNFIDIMTQNIQLSKNQEKWILCELTPQFLKNNEKSPYNAIVPNLNQLSINFSSLLDMLSYNKSRGKITSVIYEQLSNKSADLYFRKMQGYADKLQRYIESCRAMLLEIYY